MSRSLQAHILNIYNLLAHKTDLQRYIKATQPSFHMKWQL